MTGPKSWDEVNGTKHVNSALVNNAAAEAMALAYGLLWCMNIDRRDPDLRKASDARIALSNSMTMEQKKRGIESARAFIKKHYGYQPTR